MIASGGPTGTESGPQPAPGDHTESASAAAAEAAAAAVAEMPRDRGAGRFSPAVRAKLQAARLWVARNRPYYSAALFACPMIACESRPTMAIAMDHQWRIFINPGYVEAHSIKQLAASLIHEINHALRSHAVRGRRTAEPDLDAFWKVACEFEINDDLECDGLDLGDDSLLPERFGLEEQDTAEDYYRQLIEHSVCVGAAPDCGPVCSARPDHDHDHGLDSDGVQGLTAAQRLAARQATAEAVLRFELDGGDVPDGLHLWAHHTARPAVDWRQTLARALRQSLHTHTGAADYTWQRPPRRQNPADDVIRPATAAPTASIAVVWDTSASMGATDHAKALAEINAILTRAVPAQAIRVLTVDHDVNTDQSITQARQITPQGGGGTDMAKGIQTAAEARPAVIVVITDGHTPWPRTRPPGTRTTIAVLTDHYAIDAVPGWIQAIDISDADPGGAFR